MATGFEPENAESQGSVDGGLSFGGVDAENGVGRLTLAKKSAGIDGAEGFFEVDGCGQAGDGQAGKLTIERVAELLLVAGAGKFFCRGRAAVALTADFELARARLAEALHEQSQRSAFHFGVEHAANRVALGRPEVQQALVVVAGNGVFGLGQVEGHGAVFEHDGSDSLAEEVLHGAGEGVWGHEWIVHIGRCGVCDE